MDSKHIWFLRHCDKPADPHNPCCTPHGLLRTTHWASYLTPLINASTDSVSLYASGFQPSSYPLCPPLLEGRGKPSCPHSQRMFVTAHHLRQELIKGPSFLHSPPVWSQGCVGDWKHMWNHLVQSPSLASIVIWEHNEIIDILRHASGLPIGPWEDNNLYNLVFHLEIKHVSTHTHFSYDCVGMTPQEEKHCWSVTTPWLHTTPHLDSSSRHSFAYGAKVCVIIVYGWALLLCCWLCAKPTTVTTHRRFPSYGTMHEPDQSIDI